MVEQLFEIGRKIGKYLVVKLVEKLLEIGQKLCGLETVGSRVLSTFLKKSEK